MIHPTQALTFQELAQQHTSSSMQRIVPAAHEFEASLMKELLGPLQHDPLFSDDSGDGDSGSSNALSGFGAESLARAISERGGFGIAAKIIQHFGANAGLESDVPGQTSAQKTDKVTKIGTKVPIRWADDCGEEKL